MSKPITAITSTKALPCIPASRMSPNVITEYKSLYLDSQPLNYKNKNVNDVEDNVLNDLNLNAIAKPKKSYAMESAKRFGVILKETPKSPKVQTFTVFKDWKAEARLGSYLRNQFGMVDQDRISKINLPSSQWNSNKKPVVKPASHNGPETALQIYRSPTKVLYLINISGLNKTPKNYFWF
ncbi:hypothetical protein CHUAL_002505 [Chamberlinius hualienensis]